MSNCKPFYHGKWIAESPFGRYVSLFSIILSKSQNSRGSHTYHEWMPTMEWPSFPMFRDSCPWQKGRVSPLKSSRFLLPLFVETKITHLVWSGSHIWFRLGKKHPKIFVQPPPGDYVYHSITNPNHAQIIPQRQIWSSQYSVKKKTSAWLHKNQPWEWIRFNQPTKNRTKQHINFPR